MLEILFYHIDEFNKILEAIRLADGSILSTRSALTNSEIMTICVYYHYSGFKTFKDFYTKDVLVHRTKDFKNLVSYSRFVELKQMVALDLALMAQLLCSFYKCTGSSFIDSLPLPVSHSKRIYSHKVFKGMAKRGKTSVGWFFGFKLHIVIDPMGNILAFYLTSGNVADNNQDVLSTLFKDVFGKVFGDKGYLLAPPRFKYFYENGVHIVHKIKNNMENKLMDIADKLMLKYRGVVESVIDIYKIHLSVDHSRHRSPAAFLSNLFSGLIAYFFYPRKPHITLNLQAIS